MKTATFLFKENSFKTELNPEALDEKKCQFIVGFGSKEILEQPILIENLQKKFPNAQFALCSSAGEIFDHEVYDDTLSISAFEFDKTAIKSTSVSVNGEQSSFELGQQLVKGLLAPDLKYIFVLSDGRNVNGSELVKGINSIAPKDVLVTGGLAGDGPRFQSTLVGLNGPPQNNLIAAVGFYGNAIKVSHGSLSGWESFGLERTVTKSSANELFEIDGKNALELYKNYLGKYADELPSSALLFPLSMKLEGNEEPIVRTILSIDNNKKSMIFAGDLPEGAKVRFMKANFDKLVDTSDMPTIKREDFANSSPKYALLISCVGRKLVLGKRIDEEIEAVSEIFNHKTMLGGFYSYGEISPLVSTPGCNLHNQTLTITCFESLTCRC